MLQFPVHIYRERDNNVIGASHLSPTYSVIVTLSNKCMRRRLGNESRPPVSLRYSHIYFNQEFRGRQYDGCVNDWLSKYKYAAANFDETCACVILHFSAIFTNRDLVFASTTCVFLTINNKRLLF
jgi:hypothetical protein